MPSFNFSPIVLKKKYSEYKNKKKGIKRNLFNTINAVQVLIDKNILRFLYKIDFKQ